MAHSGLSRAQVMLQADQLFCALLLPLREASPPLCLFGKSILPLGVWEQNVFLHHCGRAGEEGKETNHRKYWGKACGVFYMVALEWKSQWKEHFPQKPYTWNFSRQEKVRNRWQWTGKCTTGTKLEWEGIRRQKPLAAVDKGKRPTPWNLHLESQGEIQKSGPNGKRLVLTKYGTKDRASLLP